MDELQRLILEVQGKEKLDALNASLRDEQKELTELATRLRRGAIAQDEFDQKARDSATVLRMLKDEIRDVQQAAGSSKGGGNALVQFQYILDDLINTSGGLERKLASISNNIPGFVQSIAGSGSSSIAGAVGIVSTALIALAPLAKAAWDAMSGEGQGEDKAAKVKEHLREIQAEIQRTHAEFQKLSQAPTDVEKQSAEGIGLFLKDRPNAEKAREAVGRSATNAEAHSMLTPEERDQLKAAHAASTRTDGQIAEEARDIRGLLGEAPESYAARVRLREEEMRKARTEGQARRTALLNAGRARFGEEVVTGATVAGPAGAEARRRLLGVAEGTPGLTELTGYSPEAIAAQERDYEEHIEPAHQEAVDSGHAASRAGRKRRAAQKEHDTFRARLKSAQTDAILARHAAEIRDEKKAEAQEQADADREAERSDAAWIRGKPARQKRERFDAARGLAARAAASQGFHEGNGNAPNAQELDQMATATLHHMGQGLSGDDAAMMALAGKLQQMQEAAMRFQQMQMNMRRLMGGGDNNGQFSMMPAGPF